MMGAVTKAQVQRRCDLGQERAPSKHGPRRTETVGVLIMRKLIATVLNYSLDGLLADEGTEFWKFCFDLPENREPDDPAQLNFLQSACAHIMGRTAYEAIAGSMTTSTDHPFAGILNAARKVVFSRTLKTDGGFWDGSLLIRGAHPFVTRIAVGSRRRR